jgi:hypothetical protein
MGYFVNHIFGDSSEYKSSEGAEAILRELIAELRQADGEHGDVSVGPLNADGSLSIFPDGYVIWNGEDDRDMHMLGLNADEVLALALLVANGDLDAVAAKPWTPGYGT